VFELGIRAFGEELGRGVERETGLPGIDSAEVDQAREANDDETPDDVHK